MWLSFLFLKDLPPPVTHTHAYIKQHCLSTQSGRKHGRGHFFFLLGLAAEEYECAQRLHADAVDVIGHVKATAEIR